MTDTVQQVIDEERGYLDRRNGLGIGWSGPITEAYLRGYDQDMQAERNAAEQRQRAELIARGWY